jgi:type II secretory pathway pseudopilin PulG
MTAYPAPPSSDSVPGAAPPTRMKPGHWVLLVLGVLLSMLGLGLALSGAVLLRADAAQQDGRYLTGETERYRSTGYALVSPSVVIDTGEPGTPATVDLSDVASLRLRATPVVPGDEVFLGIADTADVRQYLTDVPHSTLSDTEWDVPEAYPGGRGWMTARRGEDVPAVPGERRPDAPAGQDFWVVSATGAGTQELSVDLQPGRWTLVVMNADADRPVWVDLQAGARSELIGPVGTGLLWAGLIGIVLGIPLLLLGTAGLGRDIDPAARCPRDRPGQGPGAAPAAYPGPGRESSEVYPLRLSGDLDPRLSRGLWLVKWLLAIPHCIVLALLWIALLVTTIAAGIAILVTGRYPRAWFAFSVGVLRWSWRVGFYGYSALGTDRYPPFTLARAHYPAELDVAYPQRLSRGLVLVKWWLLAIPHLLILGIVTGGPGAGWGYSAGSGTGWGFSLLGLILLIALVALLFTGRYLTGLFDLVVGLNRWTYRVSAYVLLLRDEYPPFRLDQGPVEPAPRVP